MVAMYGGSPSGFGFLCFTWDLRLPGKSFSFACSSAFWFWFWPTAKRKQAKPVEAVAPHATPCHCLSTFSGFARGFWILLNLSSGHFADFSSAAPCVCVCVRLCVYFMFVLARYTSVSCRSAFPYLQFPGAVSLLSFSNPQYTYIGPA